METQKVLIDTSIIIDHFRKKDKSKTILVKLFAQYFLCISSVTVFELFCGVKSPEKVEDIKLLLKHLKVLDFTTEIAIQSSKIYQDLLSENKMIEFRDIFIASTAMMNKLPVATANIKHFQRIKDIVLLRKFNS